MMGGNTPAVPDMSDARITNDELDAILDEMKEMWAALIDVARMVPGSADIVEPRSKLPEVVAMVFDQAKVVPSEMAARTIDSAPKDEHGVLAFSPTFYQGKGGWVAACWIHGGWHSNPGAWRFEPTHWLPMPEKP